MAEPFLAEVKMVGYNFAQRGWAQCDGQILPINQNQSLYSLLGTTYGGDGRTSFALPDLRGRVPTHVGEPLPGGGASFSLGTRSGEERHTLTVQEMPVHDHPLRATNDAATSDQPAGNVLARAGLATYGPVARPVTMSSQAVTNAGRGWPHENMMPSLVVNFVIALRGLFPSRN